MKDLNSLNGTYLNGEKLTPNVPVTLADSDEISFGKETNVRYQFNYSFEGTNSFGNLTSGANIEFNDQTQNKPKGGFGLPNESGAAGLRGSLAGSTQGRNLKSPSLANPLNDLYNQNIDLHAKLLEREGMLRKREEEIIQLQNSNEVLKEELQFIKAKQEGIERYSEDLQQRMAQTKKEAEEEINNIRGKLQKEISETLEEKRQELERVKILLAEKESENISLRLKLESVQKTQKDQVVSINQQQQVLLDEQAKELRVAKRIISEFENAETQCTRKWNSLIEENFAKEERLKGMQQQMERIMMNYQNLLSEFNIKFNEMNVQVLRIIQKQANGANDTKEAAQFLVDQMRLLQEERKKLILENEELNAVNQDLVSDVDVLNMELGQYQAFFQMGRLTLEDARNGKSQAMVGPLKARIDELQDLIEELRRRGRRYWCFSDCPFCKSLSFSNDE